MSSAPLAQSADKSVLFARLGLNQQIHRLLLDDAECARDRLSINPGNLTDQSKADPNVRPPYKWDEISETAKHREVLTLVYNPTPETAPYYAVGRYMTNVNEENWVARWYLWHSFRYRDNRVPKTRVPLDSNNQVQNEGRSSCGTGGYYDPARGHYR